MIVGVVPYTRGHHRWNVDAISASTSPGVFVARTRSGLLSLETVRLMQRASVRAAAIHAARRTIDEEVIGGSWSRLEVELQDGGNRAVQRIVAAVRVQTVVRRDHLGVVALVFRPRVEVAADH